MAKRKVFIAIHQLNIGGAQKALISALNAIDYEKNDVTLYVRKDRLDLLPLVNKNVSEIIVNKDHTKYYRKPYTAFMTGVVFLKKLLKLNADKTEEKIRNYIVKSQLKYEKKHYFSGDIKYDVAISYIQGYTCESVVENVNAKKKILFYHTSTDSLHDMHERVFERYDRIYCVSKGSMEAVKGFYPQFAHKFDYIENFVDADRIKDKSKAFVPEYDKNKITLCTCGRMTEEKGFDLAVEAAQMLKNQGLDFKWWFVSDGRYRSKIEQMISEKGLSGQIVITGMVDNPYPYIKNCDIYVQPSYEESFGLTIYEAMILCVPIVSTSTIGAKDIVFDKEDALLCEISDKSLADSICILINDNDLCGKIKSNLSNKDYSNDYKIFCEKWEKLLEE